MSQELYSTPDIGQEPEPEYQQQQQQYYVPYQETYPTAEELAHKLGQEIVGHYRKFYLTLEILVDVAVVLTALVTGIVFTPWLLLGIPLWGAVSLLLHQVYWAKLKERELHKLQALISLSPH